MFSIKAQNIFFGTLLFSGFYISKISPISPVYFTFILGIISLFLLKANSGRLGSDKLINCYIILFLIYLLATQFFVGTNINTFINVLLSYLTFVILLDTGSQLSIDKIFKYCNRFIVFSIVLLIVECFWRISNPRMSPEYIDAIDKSEFLWIYPFKFNSFMFIDSNFVSIYTATLFFFCNYLIGVSRKRIRIYKTIFFVLTVLTFSRAAIFCVVGVSFIRMIIQMYHRHRLATTIIGVPLFLTGVIFTFNLVASDDSFLSKFYIINQAIESVKESDLTINLFGVGFGNAVNQIDIGAHNLIVTYLIESGFVGLLFMTGFSILYLSLTKGVGWDIMLVFWVIGLSLSGHAVPFYYAQLAVVMLLAQKFRINRLRPLETTL